MQFSKIFQLVAALAAFSAPALAQSAADANAGLAVRNNPAHGEPGHVHVSGDELVVRAVGGDGDNSRLINRPGRDSKKPRLGSLPRDVAEEAKEFEVASSAEGAVDASEESALEARDPQKKPAPAKNCRCVVPKGNKGLRGLLEARRDPGLCPVCKESKALCGCDAFPPPSPSNSPPPSP